ncbi:MAG: TIGR00159 family protein, partial [Candidatus Omnitrophica bacterium]|nr:TIGR00159 family protein [Candidatus Omnitrophota bacterium]
MMEFILGSWKYILEIIILWFFYYMLLVFIQGTRAVQVLKGLVVLVIIFIITQELKLETINWILTKIFTISIIAFLIIFQPELRRGL